MTGRMARGSAVMAALLLAACAQPPALTTTGLAGAGVSLQSRLMAVNTQKIPRVTKSTVRARLAHQIVVGYRTPPARTADATVLDRMPMSDGTVLQLQRLNPGETVEAGQARFRRDPNVILAEANELKGGNAESPAPTTPLPSSAPSAAAPVIFPVPDASNTWTSLQWHLARVNAPAAWKTTKGDPNLIVAVVDTGVDYTHPNLVGRVIQGPNYAASLYDDGGLNKGQGAMQVDVLDAEGRPLRTQPLSDGDLKLRSDLANKNPNDPMDDEGHGTHVAGIIAAGNTAEGVSGIAPNVKILAVKALGVGGGTDWTVAQGIRYAFGHGARIINLSLGSRSPSALNRMVCDEARKAGVLIIAAAGNDGEDLDVNQNAHFPALYPSVLTVAATKQDDTLASFSNRGTKLGLSAPGYAILSTLPTRPVVSTVLEGANPYFDVLSGTSMSAPIVSGVAALVASLHADWSPQQIEDRLYKSARHLGGSSRNATFGYGLVNAERAVKDVP